VTETARIRAIAAGGDGVGTLADGCTVFVPRTAPGDVVELTSVRRSQRLARGWIGRLVEAGSERVAPRCPHYSGEGCGGCQLQHLTPASQQDARRKLVGDALRRIGHLEVPEVTLAPSPTEWNYRAKITLAVKRRHIGFHRVGRPDEVFDLVECHIARPELNRLWAGLSAHRRILPPNTEQLVLRIDREGQRHVIVRVSGTEAWTRAAELGHALRRSGQPATLWWQPEGGAPRTVFGAAEAYPAMVFEQVHPEMGDQVRAHAVAALGPLEGRHCWDLYAGIGETTRALLAGGATVESVELDHRAVRLAETRGPAVAVTRHAGKVEQWLPRLRPADLLIVNPPRTGLGAAVASHLATPPATGAPVHLARRLVYISCDPATLARDLDRMRQAFSITEVSAFDLFPQTAHVETVVRLDRR
jgi:23S rRNA (uracil1939-C5)-methyltransferase